MSSYNEMIIKVLEQVYPDEVDWVGLVVVEDIVDGLQLEQGEASSKLDLTSALTVLATSVVLIKGILEIYFMLKEKLKREPNRAEIEDVAKTTKLVPNTKVDWNSLLDTLLEHLSAK